MIYFGKYVDMKFHTHIHIHIFLWTYIYGYIQDISLDIHTYSNPANWRGKHCIVGQWTVRDKLGDRQNSEGMMAVQLVTGLHEPGHWSTVMQLP